MKKLLYTVCLVMALAACSSIDCPLNNVVYAKYKLKGDVTKLEDYLTVTTKRADGNDRPLEDVKVLKAVVLQRAGK